MSNEVFKKANPIVQLVAMTGSAKSRNHEGPMAVTTTYHNYTGTDITVVTRNDLRFKVKSIPDMNFTGFVIREWYRIDGPTAVDIIQLFKQLGDKLSPDMLAMLPVFEQHSSLSYHSPMSFTIDTNISEESFVVGNGHVYSLNKDLMISKSGLDTAPPHPYSVTEMLSPDFKDTARGMNGINFSIEIVDNDNAIAGRVYHLAEKLFDIVPFQDSSRVTGVYLSIGNTRKDGGKDLSSVYYTIEEAEEVLGLYRTREEAKSHGDVEGARKLKLAELSHELSVIQDNNKIEIMRLERLAKEQEHLHRTSELESKSALHALEKELIIVKAAADKAKAEADQHKARISEITAERSYARQDYYENRSYERKDTSEFIKLVPALLTGVLAVAGWFALS